MKIFVTFIVLFSLVFPVFSQSSAGTQRFRALGDAMGTTLAHSTEALEDFDSRVSEGGDVRRYSHFLRQYNSLAENLDRSERRLNFLLEGNAPRNQIDGEHRNFERLLRTLERVKSEYDDWLRTVQ